MPSSIELTSKDQDILDAYDSAFDPDPRLSPLINGLSKGEKELFFEFLRECVSISFSEFSKFTFDKQNFFYELYLETIYIEESSYE